MMTAILAYPENPMLYPYRGQRVEVQSTGRIHELSGEEAVDITYTSLYGERYNETVWDSELSDWQEV